MDLVISTSIDAAASFTLLKIRFENTRINSGQLFDVADGGLFIHLVHGLGDQPKFRNRAMVVDKTSVRCATGRGEGWLDAGNFFNSVGNQFGERTRLGQERLRADANIKSIITADRVALLPQPLL